jgi:hypothetical protein
VRHALYVDLPHIACDTQLEFQYGVLRAPADARAFVYIRDQRFMHDVPDAHKAHFAPADREAFDLIERLKAAGVRACVWLLLCDMCAS